MPHLTVVDTSIYSVTRLPGWGVSSRRLVEISEWPNRCRQKPATSKRLNARPALGTPWQLQEKRRSTSYSNSVGRQRDRVAAIVPCGRRACWYRRQRFQNRGRG